MCSTWGLPSFDLILKSLSISSSLAFAAFDFADLPVETSPELARQIYDSEISGAETLIDTMLVLLVRGCTEIPCFRTSDS
jgi:hypothetical protein